MELHRRTGLGGWISPEGRYWPCPDLLHHQIAERIVRRLSLPSTSRYGAQFILERAGWLHVMDDGRVLSYEDDDVYTQAQLDALFDLGTTRPAMRYEIMAALEEQRQRSMQARRPAEQLQDLDDGAAGAAARQPGRARDRVAIADVATAAWQL